MYNGLTKPEFTNCPLDTKLVCPAEVNVVKRKGVGVFKHLFTHIAVISIIFTTSYSFSNHLTWS